jgi:phosphoenolpyruvate carboxylase
MYVNFDQDLLDAVRFMNPDSPFLSPSIKEAAERICGSEIHDLHRQVTNSILLALDDNRNKDLQSIILQAANIRKFLG